MKIKAVETSEGLEQVVICEDPHKRRQCGYRYPDNICIALTAYGSIFRCLPFTPKKFRKDKRRRGWK